MQIKENESLLGSHRKNRMELMLQVVLKVQFRSTRWQTAKQCPWFRFLIL